MNHCRVDCCRHWAVQCSCLSPILLYVGAQCQTEKLIRSFPPKWDCDGMDWEAGHLLRSSGLILTSLHLPFQSKFHKCGTTRFSEPPSPPPPFPTPLSPNPLILIYVTYRSTSERTSCLRRTVKWHALHREVSYFSVLMWHALYYSEPISSKNNDRLTSHFAITVTSLSECFDFFHTLTFITGSPRTPQDHISSEDKDAVRDFGLRVGKGSPNRRQEITYELIGDISINGERLFVN